MKTVAVEQANRCANTSRITHKSEFTFLQGGEMLWAKSPSRSFQFISSGPGTIPQRFRGAGFCVPGDLTNICGYRLKTNGVCLYIEEKLQMPLRSWVMGRGSRKKSVQTDLKALCLGFLFTKKDLRD